MMREYSITTCEGSCTPQNTAEPSMAGVKNGRPAITSTIRNQSATAAAPIRPVMNPSRRIRHKFMSFNKRTPQSGDNNQTTFELLSDKTQAINEDSSNTAYHHLHPDRAGGAPTPDRP